MREFLGELSLKYSRSGMPGKMALNGPQIDKVWKNLDLLHEKLVKQGAGVIGEGSVDYLQKLQALYFMCARYLFCSTSKSIRDSFNPFPAKVCLETMPGQSRISEMRLIECTTWGFSQKPPKSTFYIHIWRTTWTFRPRTTGGHSPLLIARAWRPVTLA